MVNNRYFAELSYLGTAYSGWQKQPKATSIQEVIENGISKILREKTEIVGCGRTDAGVHAKQYFLHFDYKGGFPEGFTNRLNKVLPTDISFKKIVEMESTVHARFDATHRAYEYHLGFNKNPFSTNTLDSRSRTSCTKTDFRFLATFLFTKFPPVPHGLIAPTARTAERIGSSYSRNSASCSP